MGGLLRERSGVDGGGVKIALRLFSTSHLRGVRKTHTSSDWLWLPLVLISRTFLSLSFLAPPLRLMYVLFVSAWGNEGNRQDSARHSPPDLCAQYEFCAPPSFFLLCLLYLKFSRTLSSLTFLISPLTPNSGPSTFPSSTSPVPSAAPSSS